MNKKIYTIGVTIFAFVLLIYLFIPLPNPVFPLDYSTVVLDNNGEILRVFLNDNQQWCFPPNDSIPAKLQTAVIHYEDRHFYHHFGINPFSILRALKQNITSNEIISGASTITMQVARLMSPKERTYLNKLLEIFQAVKIELKYSKAEILSLYLNHAPYGGNIIGYQAASLKYFRKLPKQLTWSEAALLAVLPNAPGLISPLINSKRLKEKRDKLLNNLFVAGFISRETYQLSLLEPIPLESYPFDFHAPHLGRLLKEREDVGAAIETTIEKSFQIRVEQLVADHTRYLSTLGIHNTAAVVVETQTGKVRAYVGSQQFSDSLNQGQVDGVQAPRSSGSLLKPFLYALSMDEGIILPESMIKDVPSYYGAFSPSNANQKYNGLVTAKEALVRSLNVPAVRVLFTYGQYPFYLFLKAAGMSTLHRRAEDYGLPLILGGAETNVWDMAMMFRGLASGGKFESLSVIANEKGGAANSIASDLISPGACYLTLNILRELKRPGAEYYWQQYQNQSPIAWKTGTSYSYRDGWAVGCSPQWTIAVWVGNFSGEGNPNLSGARCAAPLMFDIFNFLPKNPELAWFEKPEAYLREVNICAESGYIAGINCPDVSKTDAPFQMKPMQVCPYHQAIYVNQDQTRQVCSLCWEPGDYQQISQLIYPPDVVQYLRERGQDIHSVPPHKADCPAHSEPNPLAIVYPQQNARLWIPRDFDGQFQSVTARAAHRNSERILYWYLNDHFEGATRDDHTKTLSLPKGWNRIEVVDEIGNRDGKRFYVGMSEF